MNKRIILICAFILCSVQFMKAQKIWSEPTVYLPDEEVTWFIDLSEYMQKEGENMYIWTWAPNNPEDVAGGTWDNPTDDISKLKYVGNGVYSLTLKPTEYYHQTAEEMYANNDIFWMNIRNEAKEAVTGSIQAPRPFNTEYQEFLTSQADVRIYPSNFTYKTPISILVNIEKLNIEGKSIGALVGQNFGNLHMHSGLNDYNDHVVEANMGDAGLVKKTQLKKVAENIYKLDMTPADYYGITDEEQLNGYTMKNISFSLPTTNWALRGVTSTGADFKFYAADVTPDPDPVFTYFPQRLSQLDFITFIRTHDNGAKNLIYTITAGSKTLTGTFEGNRDKRIVTVNLFDNLKDAANVDKLHLKVTREGTDTSVEEMDIPLISISDIE